MISLKKLFRPSRHVEPSFPSLYRAGILLLVFCITNILIFSLFSTVALAVHPESLAEDEPVPTTVEDLETPLSEGFVEEKEERSLFPE